MHILTMHACNHTKVLILPIMEAILEKRQCREGVLIFYIAKNMYHGNLGQFNVLLEVLAK